MKRFVLPVLLSCLLIAGSRAEDWPLFRGDPVQTGVSPAKLPDKLKIRWKFATKDAIEGSAAIVDGVVYVGSYDERLYAIDLKTGQEKWKTGKLGPFKAAPAVKNGKVYIGDSNGDFHCVDAVQGKADWKFGTMGEITSGANFFDDRILIGSHDETLYCLDTKGNSIWTFKTQGPVNGSPAVASGKTFVAGCDSNLHVIDIKTGKEEFAVDLGGQAGATAAVLGDEVYVGTMNNEFLAVNLKTQKVAWRFMAPKRPQAFYSSAAVTSDMVVVGSRDRKVYGLDRVKGTATWEFITGGRVDSSPVIVGKRAYVGSLDKDFYVFDLQTGQLIESLTLDGAISASPAVANGCVVIGTEKGTVYCLE
jgi:outer membrane protein assembly factor BamB